MVKATLPSSFICDCSGEQSLLFFKIIIKEYYELTNNDIKFLTTYYNDILKDDIKRLKKFDDGKK